MTKILALPKLDEGPGAFLIANAWDAGSARFLATLGFQALATSSGACAGVLGRRDGTVTGDEALAHARDIVNATEPAGLAGPRVGLRQLAEAGRADHPPRRGDRPRRRLHRGRDRYRAKPLFDFDHAVERVAAAAREARQTGFVLTGAHGELPA